MSEHEITRAERKHSVLQLARRYSPRKISKILNIEEKEVNQLIKEALLDIEERNEDLGKAVMYLELERLEEVKRLMLQFINDFKDKVDPESGDITEQNEKAFDMVMKSADRLERYLARTSKLLGLDAPVKLQAMGSSEDKAPEKVLDAAIGLEKDDDDKPELPPAEFKIEDL